MLTITELEYIFKLKFQNQGSDYRYVLQADEPYKYVCATWLPDEKKWILFYEFDTKNSIRIELSEYHCRNAETAEQFLKTCLLIEDIVS